MTRYAQDWREIRRRRRSRRLADTIEDGRVSPFVWILRVAAVLAVVGGAVFWMLKGGR